MSPEMTGQSKLKFPLFLFDAAIDFHPNLPQSPILMSRHPQRYFRACLLCSIVLPIKDFVDNGCPNCQDLMSSAHDGTTSNYEGTVALINPADSWVSKWQGLTNYVPGLYAVR